MAVFLSRGSQLQTDLRLEAGLRMTVMTAMMEMMAVISNRYQTNHLGNYQEHLVRLVRHRVLLRTDLQLHCVRHYRISKCWHCRHHRHSPRMDQWSVQDHYHRRRRLCQK